MYFLSEAFGDLWTLTWSCSVDEVRRLGDNALDFVARHTYANITAIVQSAKRTYPIYNLSQYFAISVI